MVNCIYNIFYTVGNIKALSYCLLSINYIKFQLLHYSQILVQFPTHWTSFPSSIPSQKMQRSWAFYREKKFRLSLWDYSQQVVIKDAFSVYKEEFIDPDLFALVRPARDSNSNLVTLVWKSNLVCSRKPLPLRSFLQGSLQWWTMLSHCYSSEQKHSSSSHSWGICLFQAFFTFQLTSIGASSVIS